MIPIGLIAIFAFGALFFLIIPIVFLVFWLKSFNRQGIIFNECGEDENDAIIKYVKLKIKNDKGIGRIIKFHPFSPLKMAKCFDSRDWTSIKTKKRLVEGVMLYRQGDNFRPVEFRKDEQGFYLNVRDEDNRKFLMQYEIMVDRKKEALGVMKTAIISFFVFLVFATFVSVAFMWWVMDANTKAMVASSAARVVVSG